eukprot:365611-Chlamydomonas_euryale.AAC.9
MPSAIRNEHTRLGLYTAVAAAALCAGIQTWQVGRKSWRQMTHATDSAWEEATKPKSATLCRENPHVDPL